MTTPAGTSADMVGIWLLRRRSSNEWSVTKEKIFCEKDGLLGSDRAKIPKIGTDATEFARGFATRKSSMTESDVCAPSECILWSHEWEVATPAGVMCMFNESLRWVQTNKNRYM